MKIQKIFAKALLILSAHVTTGVTENKSISYDPGALLSKLFNINSTTLSRQASKSLAFDDDPNTGLLDQSDDDTHGIIFEDQAFIHRGQPLKFEDNKYKRPTQNNYLDNTQSGYGLITFRDDTSNEQSSIYLMKKKKRRRRKPRVQTPNEVYPGLNHPGPFTSGISGLSPYQTQYFNEGVNTGQYNRPSSRPKPSITSQALSAVTEALTSVALYDDLQCVPRLLCEAAGGGAMGTSGMLQNVANMEPLFMLLSAYSGLSTSPLFLFGRAVFLGMTSKGNVAACRYAYPKCPTDPEKLIYYLNNHNGGFFKFFNTPQLSNFQYGQQNFAQHDHYSIAQNGYPNLFLDPQAYGQQHQPQLFSDVNPYEYGYLNKAYGQQHQPQLFNDVNPYEYGYLNNDKINRQIYVKNYINNKIERRIQNNPDQQGSGNKNSKWLFPDNDNESYNEKDDNTFKIFTRDTKLNKNDAIRNSRTFQFPGSQTFREYMKNYVYRPFMSLFTNNNENYDDNVDFNNHNYNSANYNSNYINYNNKYGYSVQNNNQNGIKPNEDGVITVYVVRGNGDPKHPEIIKLRPGQKIS